MNSSQRRHRLSLVLLSFMSLLACASCGPSRTGIEGTVSVGGVPVDEGLISFVPQDHGGKPVVTGKIVDGRFNIVVGEGPLVGQNSVLITGGRRTGKTIDMPPDEFNPQGETVHEIEDLVPAKYREMNTLILEIKSNGPSMELKLDAE